MADLDEELLERVDPELRAVLKAMPPMDMSNIEKTRRQFSAMTRRVRAKQRKVPGVKTRDIMAPAFEGAPDVRLRVYEPEQRTEGGGALLWIHGGGMIVGTAEDGDALCQRWAAEFGCVIASVDYRLAPEHPYPAAVEDCYTALCWLYEQAPAFGADPAGISIAGASAGGGLAASAALVARDRGDVPIRFQMLVYPMLDDRGNTPSNGEFTETRIWNNATNAAGWSAYLGDRVGGSDVPIHAAPARAGVEALRGLPPAYIEVGELDPLRDESVEYAQKLMQAGVPCELHVTPGVFHGVEGIYPRAQVSRRINGYRRDAARRALT